jgi:hypothetical protein
MRTGTAAFDPQGIIFYTSQCVMSQLWFSISSDVYALLCSKEPRLSHTQRNQELLKCCNIRTSLSPSKLNVIVGCYNQIISYCEKEYLEYDAALFLFNLVEKELQQIALNPSESLLWETGERNSADSYQSFLSSVSQNSCVSFG